jgi:hypothetical protein
MFWHHPGRAGEDDPQKWLTPSSEPEADGLAFVRAFVPLVADPNLAVRGRVHREAILD